MGKLFANYRVYLRALELDDYKETIKWHTDDEIWDMVVSNKRYVSKDYEKKWVEDKIFNNGNNITLGVCIKENDKLIGQVALNNVSIENRSAEFSKMIGDKDYWGKGLAKEATMLMLHHGFFDLGLERIQAKQLLDNPTSIHVNMKCGFKSEGILRKVLYKKGELVDLNLMSVLKEDYFNLINEK